MRLIVTRKFFLQKVIYLGDWVQRKRHSYALSCIPLSQSFISLSHIKFRISCPHWTSKGKLHISINQARSLPRIFAPELPKSGQSLCRSAPLPEMASKHAMYGPFPGYGGNCAKSEKWQANMPALLGEDRFHGIFIWWVCFGNWKKWLISIINNANDHF